MKKMFKVLTHVETKNGAGFWMRVGSAFLNKDESINIHLDAIPKTFELHLRELDEEDLRKRESNGSRTGAAPSLPLGGPPPSDHRSADGLPF